MVKMFIYDYSAKKEVEFGPYAQIDLLEHTVWAHFGSSKFEIASRDSQGFWVVSDPENPELGPTRTREIWIRTKL